MLTLVLGIGFGEGVQFLVEEFMLITCSLHVITLERELISIGTALLCLKCGSQTDKKLAVVPGNYVLQQGVVSGSKRVH